MKCKKCGFELVDGQDICPRCGASQSGAEQSAGGVSMELPATESPKAAPAEPQKEEKGKAEKSNDVKKTVKQATEKAKKGAKKAAQKVKEVSKDAAENVEEAAKDVADKAKKGGSKTWLYVLIGVAAVVVLIIVGYFVIAYEPKGDEMQSVILASSEDAVFLVDGDTLTELADVPEGLEAREVLTAIDGNSFYLISDAEYDEDAGEFIGDLVYLKSNGKEDEIDSDVIVGSLEIIGGLAWYEKADDDEVIVCCYDGRNVTEVIEEETLSNWIGTDKAGKAYYSLIDEDDYTTEVFLIENGDDESIMDEAQIVTVSEDFKKLLLVTQDDGESTVHIYDGRDDFEVMEDVQDILLDNKTFDMIVVADADDLVLYYIPYGKEEIEIDDEVDEILTVPNLYSPYFTEDLGSMIYYGKEGDLYAADFRGKDSDRILKNYDELSIISQEQGSKEIVYVDDDEIVWVNIDTLKETSVELPDADDLRSYDVALVGNWFVYRTEDNKELFAFDGRRDPIELSDDADEITGFTAFMDKYVLWQNIDDELVISEMKEDSDEEIGDDVYTYWATDSGEIYFLSDYEDGEGDLYYMPRVGREADRIEKDITSLFRLYYE
jgi:hypothetical protein